MCCSGTAKFSILLEVQWGILRLSGNKAWRWRNFKNAKTNMKTIIAFGNPLLDVTVSSKDHVLSLINKYNLKIDGQKEISYSEMNLLSKDIQGMHQHISPGGCSQNSLRVLQWILKKQCNASIFGSVGKDPEADILKRMLESEGVHARYIIQENLTTGKTVALTTGVNRSLVAHIGAAEVFDVQSLLSYPDFMILFKSSDIILIEAYFLTNRIETAKHLVELCKKYEKLLVFNLCGDYIFKIIPEAIKYLVNHASVVFGNKTEFIALASLLNHCSLEKLARTLIQENEKQDKLLVITDGPNPILCYSKDGIIKIKTPTINPNEIKDTTAAGDAFLGGFLAGMVMLKNIKECLNIGIYAASSIIKQSGCSIPTFEPQISFLNTDN